MRLGIMMKNSSLALALAMSVASCMGESATKSQAQMEAERQFVNSLEILRSERADDPYHIPTVAIEANKLAGALEAIATETRSNDLAASATALAQQARRLSATAPRASHQDRVPLWYDELLEEAEKLEQKYGVQ